jgi:hypothetical protein
MANVPCLPVLECFFSQCHSTPCRPVFFPRVTYSAGIFQEAILRKSACQHIYLPREQRLQRSIKNEDGKPEREQETILVVMIFILRIPSRSNPSKRHSYALYPIIPSHPSIIHADHYKYPHPKPVSSMSISIAAYSTSLRNPSSKWCQPKPASGIYPPLLLPSSIQT